MKAVLVIAFCWIVASVFTMILFAYLPFSTAMSNQAIAAHILAKCSRRLTGREHALCISIAEGIHSYEQIASSDWNWFESLKTQFAADLAYMAEPVKIEANPQDPAFL